MIKRNIIVSYCYVVTLKLTRHTCIDILDYVAKWLIDLYKITIRNEIHFDEIYLFTLLIINVYTDRDEILSILYNKCNEMNVYVLYILMLYYDCEIYMYTYGKHTPEWNQSRARYDFNFSLDAHLMTFKKIIYGTTPVKPHNYTAKDRAVGLFRWIVLDLEIFFDFISNFNLTSVNLQEGCSGPIQTFVGPTGSSTIDHILVPSDMISCVIGSTVLGEDILNCSDYYPVIVEIDVGQLLPTTVFVFVCLLTVLREEPIHVKHKI